MCQALLFRQNAGTSGGGLFQSMPVHSGVMGRVPVLDRLSDSVSSAPLGVSATSYLAEVSLSARVLSQATQQSPPVFPWKQQNHPLAGAN